jgi:hypothetical protein
LEKFAFRVRGSGNPTLERKLTMKSLAQYALFGAASLWGIWGIDLVNHLELPDAWWTLDLKCTLFFLPCLVWVWLATQLSKGST